LRRNRHQIVTRVFQIAGISLVLLDVLLYFVVYRQTQSQLSSELEQFASLRQRIFDGEARIERLTKYRAGLPDTDRNLAALIEDHTLHRRTAYSQAFKLLRLVAQHSGAELGKVEFKRNDKVGGPLLPLGAAINAEGSFPQLLKFAHGLETASDLLVIRSFSMTEGEDTPQQLRLVVDMYFTP
jgi:hypothetical protein